MKGYSTFPRAPGLEPDNQMVQYHIQHSLGWSYRSAEIQSSYSTATADYAGTVVDKGGSYFSQWYLFEIERDSATGVRIGELRCRNPAR